MTALLPIALLMIEHRVIGRMIRIVKLKTQEIKRTNEPDQAFIEALIDFIRTYVDQNHHGKEEDILFRDLKKKKISTEHKKIMNELLREHFVGRQTTSQLEAAKNHYYNGKKEELSVILEKMGSLATLYPRHIEKEDKHFFLPCMDYFSRKEKDDMLEEFWRFDSTLIHKKYSEVVEKMQKARG